MSSACSLVCVATQGGAATRLGLALLWPLGPLAFLITVAGLLVVAAIAFPLFGILLAANESPRRGAIVSQTQVPSQTRQVANAMPWEFGNCGT